MGAFVAWMALKTPFWLSCLPRSCSQIPTLPRTSCPALPLSSGTAQTSLWGRKIDEEGLFLLLVTQAILRAAMDINQLPPAGTIIDQCISWVVKVSCPHQYVSQTCTGTVAWVPLWNINNSWGHFPSQKQKDTPLRWSSQHYHFGISYASASATRIETQCYITARFQLETIYTALRNFHLTQNML